MRHELFTEVLEEFRESDVLVKAIRNKKTTAVNWLMTMGMNYLAQDENEVTTLMRAAENSSYLSVMKEILEKCSDAIYITDINDSTALFYANGAEDDKPFSLLLQTKIDSKHINRNEETLLLNCCKRRFCPNFEKILSITDDIDHANKSGMTAAMLLVENGKYKELKSLCDRNNPNLDYINQNNESVVSILMKNLKRIYMEKSHILFKDYIYTMYILTINNCNFNIPIDKEGNTPLMYFMMIKDFYATAFLLEKCKNLDLSIKNNQGISASYLLFRIPPSEGVLRRALLNHETFDYNFADSYNNDLVMHFLYRGTLEDIGFRDIVRRKEKVNHVNHKDENAVIIATKLGVLSEELIEGNDVNQQDYLGNTALHYAVKLRDRITINRLVYHKADPTIKNSHGVSAVDLVNEMNEEEKQMKECIIDILKNPLSPGKMKDKVDDEGTVFLLFDKKKSKDEKLNDYIKNYQIKNYEQEYEDTLAKLRYKCTYTPMPYDIQAEDYQINIYYHLYSMNAPKSMEAARKRNKVDVLDVADLLIPDSTNLYINILKLNIK